MDKNGRFNHIEDVICRMFPGCWFGWKDSKNKTYENLIVHKNTDGRMFLEKFKQLPTKEFLLSELADKQAAWDHEHTGYRASRRKEYPPIGDQLDMLWHAIDQGKLDKTSEFYKYIKAIKDKHPKS